MTAPADISRFLAYAGLVALVSLTVLFIGLRMPGGLQLSPGMDTHALVAGSSWVELLQYLLLLNCAGIFGWLALRDRLRRPLALVFLALLGLALIRELHEILDRTVTDNFWQVLAALVTVIVGVYEYRHHQRLALGWQRSQPSAGLAIVLVGCMLLLFVQLLGRPDLWAATLDVAEASGPARVFEELGELAAYLVILIGSLEFLHGWSRLPQTRRMDRPRRRRRGARQ